MPFSQVLKVITYGCYTWEPAMTGKLDFLELFSGSAKLSQAAAMQGLRVGRSNRPPHRLRLAHCRRPAKGNGSH